MSGCLAAIYSINLQYFRRLEVFSGGTCRFLSRKSMSWWELPRIPEDEVMAEPEKVSAYASAAAQAYLNSLDETFVQQVLESGVSSGLALDIGTGPGRIPLRIARENPRLKVFGVDRSKAMVRAAKSAAQEWNLGTQVQFFLGDANCLCFPDAVFDLVFTNSLIHHLENPILAFREMTRVTRPGGWVMVRDIRRPSRFSFPLAVALHGRHYKGFMRQLYVASLRSAYTYDEFRELLNCASLGATYLFLFRRTHLGFVMQKGG